MRGCLQAIAVRRTRGRRDGPEYPLTPPHGSARFPQLDVATR